MGSAAAKAKPKVRSRRPKNTPTHRPHPRRSHINVPLAPVPGYSVKLMGLCRWFGALLVLLAVTAGDSTSHRAGHQLRTALGSFAGDAHANDSDDGIDGEAGGDDGGGGPLTAVNGKSGLQLGFEHKQHNVFFCCYRD